jgi:SAM-dependent methyltransferase
MGIDLHNLRFMLHSQDLGVSFDRTLAIGRQAVFAEARALQALARLRGLPELQQAAAAPGRPAYFEPLMQQWLGAQDVDAVDASAYEGACFIHDMNLPWPADLPGRGHYDAVLDFGCLEHVFDFAQAWRNVAGCVRVGGHVLHALPANNLAGHGFYQFSPELFFNLYQPSRGWELRALMYALPADLRHWWRVASPLQVRRRVNLRNAHEVYMLVLARKLRETGVVPAPQQSDYAQSEWLATPGAAPAQAPQASPWQRPLAALGLLDQARRGRARWQALRASGLGLPAPDYERIVVQQLLSR